MSPFRYLGLLMLLFLFSACGQNSADKIPADTVNAPQDEEAQEDVKEESQTSIEEKVELKSFFMRDGAVASYIGEGNEYASYQARTQWHNDDTVSINEDNGGTTVIRTYRITDDSIDLIKEQGEFYEQFNPTNEDLKSLPTLSTFLQLPLEKGTTFDEWTLVNVEQTLETPYETFNHVIVLEKTDDNGAIQRKYLVKGFGEVKREFLMKENDAEFIVTSILETVE
ncbi:hypothetical protein M9R32_01640 [Paenisporosarcina quisquiliarum]|uniref:Outer membrane lipoprotein-sorting protein n=1 Tax=Paenisporosarcina quisquiliarum TaxID=365346 RepID=A0A9X3RBR7_9BACL|nr:hypothetical protein [Paenisporosarcina quisquiliarum]MCZ8535890.1 hypothetical protein [Paenisporosarcina quisquiliarum]